MKENDYRCELLTEEFAYFKKINVCELSMDLYSKNAKLNYTSRRENTGEFTPFSNFIQVLIIMITYIMIYSCSKRPIFYQL